MLASIHFQLIFFSRSNWKTFNKDQIINVLRNSVDIIRCHLALINLFQSFLCLIVVGILFFILLKYFWQIIFCTCVLMFPDTLASYSLQTWFFFSFPELFGYFALFFSLKTLIIIRLAYHCFPFCWAQMLVLIITHLVFLYHLQLGFISTVEISGFFLHLLKT